MGDEDEAEVCSRQVIIDKDYLDKVAMTTKTRKVVDALDDEKELRFQYLPDKKMVALSCTSGRAHAAFGRAKRVAEAQQKVHKDNASPYRGLRREEAITALTVQLQERAEVKWKYDGTPKVAVLARCAFPSRPPRCAKLTRRRSFFLSHSHNRDADRPQRLEARRGQHDRSLQVVPFAHRAARAPQVRHGAVVGRAVRKGHRWFQQKNL